MTDTPGPEREIVEVMARAIYDSYASRRSNAPHWGDHSAAYRDSVRADAQAALSALSAAGWRVTRSEPTAEMITAAVNASPIYGLSEKWQQHEKVMRSGDASFEFANIWSAMLAAAEGTRHE